MRIIVTGGAGFIGSALVRHLIGETVHHVIVLDKLTYAGNLESLTSVTYSNRFDFVQMDVCDRAGVRELFLTHEPDAVIHLAAESHVDRSIDVPSEFVNTNVNGSFVLLDESTRYWSQLPDPAKDAFRFVNVSTDEVFGSLVADECFTDDSPYDPRSPYSASKAAADHLSRAWFHTYGLPVLVTNCSNNYGPYQFPEKLIPLMINRAFAEQTLPIYGDGMNVRDWLYVDDHVRALMMVLERGRPGSTYLIGGRSERSNLDVVKAICAIVDELAPRPSPRQRLIEFVQDRPGHDFRYAIDPSKIENELGWRTTETFFAGLRKTIRWYMDNTVWSERVVSGAYKGQRLGLGKF